jgi:DNA-binding MarR family transcriptional regulator
MEGFASSRLGMARFILIEVFLIEQRWRYFIDKDMGVDGMTTNQWLMAIVVAYAFKSPPSIHEVADVLSTTHQNVKQIAAGMERRGLMAMERDEKNKRIIRLKVTDRCFAIFKRREENDIKTMLGMFENLSDEEMKALFTIIAKMEYRAKQLYEDAKNGMIGMTEESCK